MCDGGSHPCGLSSRSSEIIKHNYRKRDLCLRATVSFYMYSTFSSKHLVANFNHLVGVNISQPSSAYCFPFVFMRFGCLHPEVTFKYANLRPHLLRMTFSLLSVSGWKPPILDSDGKFLGASARAELRTSKWREAVCQGDAELSAWCCCQRLGWLRTRSCSSMDHSWATCEGEWDNGASRAEREMCFGKDGAWWHNK